MAWSLLLFKLVLRELLTFAEIFLFYTLVKRKQAPVCVWMEEESKQVVYLHHDALAV